MLKNKNTTLCTEKQKKRILALRSELLLLECALDERCNTILTVALLWDF